MIELMQLDADKSSYLNNKKVVCRCLPKDSDVFSILSALWSKMLGNYSLNVRKDYIFGSKKPEANSRFTIDSKQH